MTMTPADTGRRVRSVEGDLGTITSVLEAHGIIYVKFDYQLEQDRPYPTTDPLLEFVQDDHQEAAVGSAAYNDTSWLEAEFDLAPEDADRVRAEVDAAIAAGNALVTLAEPITEAPPELSDRLIAELRALEAQTQPQPVKRGPGRPRKVRA